MPQEVIPQGRETDCIDEVSDFSHHESCEYGKKKGMVHKKIL
jgi:hypothetical protein